MLKKSFWKLSGALLILLATLFIPKPATAIFPCSCEGCALPVSPTAPSPRCYWEGYGIGSCAAYYNLVCYQGS